jgi:undecaprenyl-diphosphatase
MTLLLAILLGLIQGLTEFLPISSSGHLALFGKWFGLGEADINFDIILHLATLVAILLVYRKDVLKLAMAPFKKDREGLVLTGFLVLATLPAAVIGILFKDELSFFHNHTLWVALFLTITGVILLGGFFFKEERNQALSGLTVLQVLVMGFAQAFAILPGISRSGMTIMAGIFLGLNKEEAARFSFLMALPAISGAGILMARDLQVEHLSTMMVPYSLGFLCAFVSSLAALKLLLFILKGRRFFFFGFYCFAMAVLAVAFQ